MVKREGQYLLGRFDAFSDDHTPRKTRADTVCVARTCVRFFRVLASAYACLPVLKE